MNHIQKTATTSNTITPQNMKHLQNTSTPITTQHTAHYRNEQRRTHKPKRETSSIIDTARTAATRHANKHEDANTVTATKISIHIPSNATHTSHTNHINQQHQHTTNTNTTSQIISIYIDRNRH